MSKIKDSLKSIRELLYTLERSVGYSLRFTPKETTILVVFAFLTASLPFIASKSLALVIDTLIAVATQGAALTILWPYVAFYSVMQVLPDIVRSIDRYFYYKWLTKFEAELEVEYNHKMATIDIARYEDPEFQTQLTKANYRGTWPLRQLTDYFIQNIASIVGVIIASVIVLKYNYVLFIVITLASIPKFYVELAHGKRVWNIFSEDSEKQKRYGYIRSNTRGAQSIIENKLLQNIKFFLHNARLILNEFTAKQIANERRKSTYKVLSEIIAAIGYAIVIFSVVQDVTQGLLAIGSMVFILGSCSRLESSISGFLYNIANQHQSSLWVSNILVVLDTPQKVVEKTEPTPLNLTTAPQIVFENVSFKYEGTEKLVLENINLTITPGAKIALVGNNGAGKTTLIKLLCRIYDPTEGRILVNGIDLKDVRIDEWWSYLGILFQDFNTFQYTAKEAIAMGRIDGEYNHDLMLMASKQSSSHEFISEWKDQYGQMIGKQFAGVELSKGQSQKLALARIFYRNPFVLVLDEPTASIDAESEMNIFDEISTFSKNMTAFLISHRFSTVRKADRIIVLKDARIIEDGTHESLMSEEGLYANLFKLQAEGYN